MSTRKQFIAAAASAPLVAAAAAPSSSPSPKPPQISEAAKALAERMRAFDPALTEKELEDIAAGIDGNLKVGRRVNPHGTALKNWDEPVTVFEVPS